MITRLRFALWVVNFASAIWILGVVIFGLIAKSQHIPTPMPALWLFIATGLARLIMWLYAKIVARP